MDRSSAGALVALAGYAAAAPFVLHLPLFKRMWNDRDTRLLAVHLSGVAAVTAGWGLRDRPAAAVPNGLYGLALAAAWVLRD